ncbi:MAG: DUF58 domain-containing protein [Desulfurococcales archaeon]|nr:DUF58 domain-containing protein [Desulfurococcales archaeon]
MRIEPTWRAVYLAIASLSFLLSGLFGVARLLSLATASFITIILAASYGVASRSARQLYNIEVVRRHNVRTGEGAPLKIIIEARKKNGEWPSYMIVEDRPPKRLRAKGTTRIVLKPVQGEDMIIAEYHVTPAPGYHQLDYLVSSTGDPFGLFKHYRVHRVRTSISVYPMSIGEFMISSSRRGLFELTYSRYKGFETEFYQIREYVPGDDIRRIVWTATARTGNLMVWEGIMGAKEDVALFLDLSLESWPGSPGMAPADWIMRTSLEISRRVAGSGGNVYYYIYRGNTWESWGPLRGSDAVDVLRLRLSVTGPGTVDNDINKVQALDRFFMETPTHTRKIVLLGPGTRLKALKQVLKRYPLNPLNTIIVVYLPSGDTELDTAIRRVMMNLLSKEQDSIPVDRARLVIVDSLSKVLHLMEAI